MERKQLCRGPDLGHHRFGGLLPEWRRHDHANQEGAGTAGSEIFSAGEVAESPSLNLHILAGRVASDFLVGCFPGKMRVASAGRGPAMSGGLLGVAAKAVIECGHD